MKVWTCPFCFSRNHFPPHYAEVSEVNLPGAYCPSRAVCADAAAAAELFPSYPAVEYALPTAVNSAPPAFLFVVDTALGEEELRDACASVAQAVSLLPESARVGLISFGALVAVHELGVLEPVPRAWVLKGDGAAAEYEPDRVQQCLGLTALPRSRSSQPVNRTNSMTGGGAGGGLGPPSAGGGPPGPARFLAPLSDAEFALTQLLDGLLPDPPPGADTRPERCTGAALSVAVALLEAANVGACGGRILLFTGGPATVGPAAVVAPPRAEALRSHKDFEKGSAPKWGPAIQHYAALAQRCVTAALAFDVAACALDQVGLAEMKSLAEPTGGIFIMAETFRADACRASVAKLLERTHPGGTLALCGAGAMEVFACKELRVAGAVGAAAPLPPRAPVPSPPDSELGMGGTNRWRLCSLGASTSLAVFFEVVATSSSSSLQPHGGAPAIVQFATTFTTADGARRMRVATCARRWAEGGGGAPVPGAPGGGGAIAAGFDQEAAAVLLARLAAHRAEHEEGFDALRWLDRTLIRACARFGEYAKDAPATFALPPTFCFLPQFVFNLRRSPLLQVFNNSPDETAFFRLALAREALAPSLLMIQPTLVAYSLDAPGPMPVALDVGALAPDRQLLLDSFFTVVLHTGATLAAWRKAGYAELPEHGALADLLAGPLATARAAALGRCPIARLVLCDQGGSQARFLLARLNPSATHATPPDASAGTESASCFVRAFVRYGLTPVRSHFHGGRQPASVHGTFSEACSGGHLAVHSTVYVTRDVLLLRRWLRGGLG